MRLFIRRSFKPGNLQGSKTPAEWITARELFDGRLKSYLSLNDAVCGRSLPGIAGSNPAADADVVSFECCVSSSRGLYVGLTARPEESYRVWCIAVRSWSLDNEEALAHWGALAPWKGVYIIIYRMTNEYGAMVERYWQGKTEVLGEKHYTAWVVDEWMSMEQWWNDTDRGKLKYWEENIIQRGW